jgi:hypothetical protein
VHSNQHTNRFTTPYGDRVQGTAPSPQSPAPTCHCTVGHYYIVWGSQCIQISTQTESLLVQLCCVVLSMLVITACALPQCHFNNYVAPWLNHMHATHALSMTLNSILFEMPSLAVVAQPTVGTWGLETGGCPQPLVPTCHRSTMVDILWRDPPP